MGTKTPRTILAQAQRRARKRLAAYSVRLDRHAGQDQIAVQRRRQEPDRTRRRAAERVPTCGPRTDIRARSRTAHWHEQPGRRRRTACREHA